MEEKITITDLDTLEFRELCVILNKKNATRSKNDIIDRMEPITKEGMISLINDNLSSLSPIEQHNVRIYIKNNQIK